jgi:beta-lactamase regulating signal transducer with metallopeptidase domain
MNPDLLLGVVTALAGFLLKTSLAFGVCLVLSWLADSPGRRFLIWSGLLYGMAGYWLWLARGIFASAPVLARGTSVLARPISPGSAFEIPGFWAGPLGLAMRVAGIVYLLISCYLLFAHIKNLRQLKWILGFTSQPPVEIEEAFEPLAKKLGVARSRLLILSGATSPATFGWLRPTIVLPEVCLQQDRSELEDILRHELHHVRRADFVWNGLSVVCRALLFFHPAAWYAVKKMGFERELACDLAAVSDSPEERAKYAECLIHFARLNATQSAANWGIDFAASSDHLKTRVHSILAGSRKLSAWLVCSRIACGLALLAGFVYVEPSLGILLTYARQQIVRPQTTEIQTAPANLATRSKSARRSRLSASPTAAKQAAAVASLGQTTQAVDVPADSGMSDPASGQSSAGPQLLRRGASALGAAKRQTVVPIEDGSGQSVKGGDHDRKQAVQQTATAAAGLFKRLSEFDRH